MPACSAMPCSSCSRRRRCAASPGRRTPGSPVDGPVGAAGRRSTASGAGSPRARRRPRGRAAAGARSHPSLRFGSARPSPPGHRSAPPPAATGRSPCARRPGRPAAGRGRAVVEQHGRVVCGLALRVDQARCSHGRPAARRRLVMPLVVIEAEMSTSTGSPASGKPSASGLGVNTACVPPNGATLGEVGVRAVQQPQQSLLGGARAGRRPGRRCGGCAGSRACRCPGARHRGGSVASRRCTSQGPGRRRPSHSAAAPSASRPRGGLRAACCRLSSSPR